jgi:hypothetical protein
LQRQQPQRRTLELPKYFFVENKLVSGFAAGLGVEHGCFHTVAQRVAPAHKHADASIGQLPVNVPARA